MQRRQPFFCAWRFEEFLQVVATTRNHFGANRPPSRPDSFNKYLQRILSHICSFLCGARFAPLSSVSNCQIQNVVI